MDARTLTNNMASQLNMSREEVAGMFESLAAVIVENCGRLDSVAVPGFGNFEAKKREERIAMHMHSGKRMLFPPKVILTFKPSAILKKRVKEGGIRQ